jgi:hypothetical protein
MLHPPLIAPEQHSAPCPPPHGWQVPFEHTSLPDEQLLPGQHVWLVAPQTSHVPPSAQNAPETQGLPELQHGPLAMPQALQSPL